MSNPFACVDVFSHFIYFFFYFLFIYFYLPKSQVKEIFKRNNAEKRVLQNYLVDGYYLNILLFVTAVKSRRSIAL